MLLALIERMVSLLEAYTPKVTGSQLYDPEIKEPTSEYTYPLWFQSAITSVVVKFTGIETGTVVVPSKVHKVGYQSSSWIKHTSKTLWIEVSEPVGCIFPIEDYFAQELPMNTKVLVWNDSKYPLVNSTPKHKAYCSRDLKDGRIVTFPNGQTSWSCNDEGVVWDHWELALIDP